jgi:hypothetical protein
MSPAEIVIETFGGIRPTARLLDVAPSSVFRWLARTSEAGVAGAVPDRYWEALLQAARGLDKPLTKADLANGRKGSRTIMRNGVKSFESMVLMLGK